MIIIYILLPVLTFVAIVCAYTYSLMRSDRKKRKTGDYIIRYKGKEYRRNLIDNPVTDEELEAAKRRYEEAAEMNRQYIEELNRQKENE